MASVIQVLAKYANVFLSIRLSAWKKLGSHLMDFHEISYLSIFWIPVEKLKYH